MDMTEYAEPYREYVVESRLRTCSAEKVNCMAVRHMCGVTVGFYNTELLDGVGIDYTTIKTWDDFKEAGSKYHEETGKSFGNLDTSTNMFFNLLVAELGSDYVDSDGNLSVNNQGIVDAIQLMKDLQDANAVSLMPGGNTDADEGFLQHMRMEILQAMIMPLWMSNRFINYMSDLSGKIADSTGAGNRRREGVICRWWRHWNSCD